MKTRHALPALALSILINGPAPADAAPAKPLPAMPYRQGVYFTKKAPDPIPPLPTFAKLKEELPAPVFESNPDLVDLYWKAWEFACRGFRNPAPGSWQVSPFADPGFNSNVQLIDSCYMSLYHNSAHPLTPGIGSLDNFYARQHPDGEICREINRDNGLDFWANHDDALWCSYLTKGQRGKGRGGQYLLAAWGYAPKGPKSVPVPYIGRPAPAIPPRLTLDGLDQPHAAWAEIESYQSTGDRDRLQRVYPALVKYYQSLREYIRQGNGLYMTSWAGMDNSPRNPYLTGGGCGVDSSCQMVLFARNLAAMAKVLGHPEQASRWTNDADATSTLINKLMWDPDKRFYFDLNADNRWVPVKTVAGFWPLLAQVASPDQVAALAAELENPATFKRIHRVPSLAADQEGYRPEGNYWQGSIWPQSVAMVVRGLERNDRVALARDIALNHLRHSLTVFRETGTFWENYAPDSIGRGNLSHGDFVGAAGLAPILLFLEYEIGLKPDAPSNTLTWTLHGSGNLGCQRYRFNGHLLDLLASPDNGHWNLTLNADREFTLKVIVNDQTTLINARPGKQTIQVPALSR